MKTKSLLLAIAALFVGVAGMPAKLGAQPENHPYVFYSEESGGGSYWESTLVISRPIALAICT